MKNRSMIFEIIKKEIRDVVRDKKTLIMMILVPILLYPIIMGSMLVIFDDMGNVDEEAYNTIGFTFETNEVLDILIEELKIQKRTGTEKQLQSKLENGEINAYITLNDRIFTVYYNAEDTYGSATEQLATGLLEGYKQYVQSNILINEGLVPDEIFNVYIVETKEISNKNQFTESIIGIIPSLIIMVMVLAAGFAAIDMTAGEKERGTLETLLTFPIKSGDIITGKFIATTICSIISGILGFFAMYLSLYYLSGALETFKGMEMLSLETIVFAIILFVIFSMLVSAISIMIASRAKSFKEAQNAIQPLSFISIVTMFIPMLGVELDGTTALIPFVNVSMIMTKLLSNTINIHYFILMMISNILFVIIVLKLITKLYKSDKILFS